MSSYEKGTLIQYLPLRENMKENGGPLVTCQKFNTIRHNVRLLRNFPKLKLGIYNETIISSTMHVMEWG